MRRKIHSICTESTSRISMRLRGVAESQALSPVRQRILRAPIALAPMAEDCRVMRVTSRAAIWNTGSAPRCTATAEQAQEDMRGVADAPSVKLTAVTYGLTRSILLFNLLVETVMGG